MTDLQTKCGPARIRFTQLSQEWAEADRVCGITYVAWVSACERREKLAIATNNAWGDLIMEEVVEGASTHKETGGIIS